MARPVQRQAHRPRPPVEEVRVDHRRGDVPVTQKLLHRSDLVAVLEEVRGERVPERVAGTRLGHPRHRAVRQAGSRRGRPAALADTPPPLDAPAEPGLPGHRRSHEAWSIGPRSRPIQRQREQATFACRKRVPAPREIPSYYVAAVVERGRAAHDDRALTARPAGRGQPAPRGQGSSGSAERVRFVVSGTHAEAIRDLFRFDRRSRTGGGSRNPPRRPTASAAKAAAMALSIAVPRRVN